MTKSDSVARRSRDANDRVLLDALCLRELMGGRVPHRGLERASFSVSWPEYLLLARVAWRLAFRPSQPAVVDAVAQAAGSVATPYHWVHALLDLNRVEDLHGLHVSLRIPRPEVATSVLAAMASLDLEERDATNLVLAESEQMLYLVHADTISDRMYQALTTRGIQYELVNGLGP